MRSEGHSTQHKPHTFKHTQRIPHTQPQEIADEAGDKARGVTEDAKQRGESLGESIKVRVIRLMFSAGCECFLG